MAKDLNATGRWLKKIGICPMARGQLIGVRPLGDTHPVSTSAIAFPASLPRNQAASTASAFSTSQGTISGRPENKITITGVEVSLACSNTASASRL